MATASSLVVRSTRFGYFYTENGVVPMELARDRARDHAFSFYWVSDHALVTASLFAISAIIAIQLIIGYRTTVATFLSFLLVISLDHRNTLVLSHADLIFALLLFWAMFIPLGERWSIDSLQRNREPRLRVASLGTAAILLQMVYMYLVNGYQKLDSEAWNSGEATPIIFGLDDMTFFLAEPMRQFPTMLMIGGTTWYFMLLASPLLIFLPGRLRILFAFMFIIAHASFAVTVRIGGFAPVALAGAMLFLPTRFWLDLESISRMLGITGSRFARVRGAIEQAGRFIADRLAAPGKPWGVPSYVRDGAYDIGLTCAILVVFVFPTLNLLADGDHIEWEQSTFEERVQDKKRMFAVRQPPWNVFAPNPRNVDRYYVFPAHTEDGELIDLYNDRPFTFERPTGGLHRQYKNYRERFYMNNIRRDEDRRDAPVFLASYLCDKWREKRDIELTHINMYVVNEIVTVDTITEPDQRERRSDLLSTHGCFGNDPVVLDLPEDPP
jgi:hypothetical protein